MTGLPILTVLSALVPAYALVLATPGPNLLVVLRASLAGSAPAPVAAALGIGGGAGLAATGAVLVALAVTRGASVDVHALEIAGRVAFAALLARAGWCMLRRSGRAAMPSEGARVAGYFRLGLVVALCNPMTVLFMAAFFLSLPEARDLTVAPLVCGLVALMAGGWFSLVGLLLGRARLADRLAGAGRWPGLAVGAALLAFAVLTAWPLQQTVGTSLVAQRTVPHGGEAGVVADVVVEAAAPVLVRQIGPMPIADAQPVAMPGETAAAHGGVHAAPHRAIDRQGVPACGLAARAGSQGAHVAHVALVSGQAQARPRCTGEKRV